MLQFCLKDRTLVLCITDVATIIQPHSPLNKVHHDVSGCRTLYLGVDVLPGHPGPDVRPSARLARLIKVSKVLLIE